MENQQQLRNVQVPQGGAQNGAQQENENTISLRDIVFLVINNWYWFALSLFVCLVIAGVVYKTKPKVYEYTGTILVRDEINGKGQQRNIDQIFSNMDVGMHSLENEVYMLKSSLLAKKVVSALDLNKTCERNSFFTKISYFRDRPLDLKVYTRSAEASEVSIYVEVTPLDMSRYEYLVKSLNRYSVNKKGVAYYTEPVVVTEDVSFTIDKTQFFSNRNFKITYQMAEVPVTATAVQVSKRLAVNRVDKNAAVLSLKYSDNNEARAREVVTAMVDAYNDDAAEDNRAVAEKTEQFVSERIGLISGELEDVDAQVAQLKKEARLPDLQTASGTMLQTGIRYSEEVNSLEAELQMIKAVKSYLVDPNNKDELLPANVVVSNPGVQSMISQYNSQMLQYRKLLNTAGPNNPQVKNLVQQMEGNRASILASIDNLISSTNVRLQTARAQEARAQGQIYNLPTQSKAVTEVSRQQKIKEELFLYLLSKREENAMNLAVTIVPAKIVEPAARTNMGPHLSMYILVGLILGAALPALVMFLINFFNVKLRSKSDIERAMTIPILGEIPQKPEGRANDEIIVTANGTDVVTEAFRILHSNIPFFLKENEKVIQTVSTVPGEGKSFVALNLALSLAYLGKKTILVDCDLRKRSLSKTIDRHNRLGLISYMLGKEEDFKNIIMHSETSPFLDYIVCEKTPPNATQLLLTNKMDALVEYLREQYDYVILDSTPAQIVADSAIINHNADLTTYIMRVGYLNKSSFPFIQELSDKGKFKNMAIIMTDVPVIKRR